MQFGKWLAAFMALALLVSGVAGFAETGSDEAKAAQEEAAKQGKTVGQVTKIDAGTVELLLGELDQGGGPGAGGPGGKSGNGPGGDDAQTPPGKSDGKSGDSRNTPPQMPGGDKSEDGASGATPRMPGGKSTFRAGEETLTLELTDAVKVLIEESGETAEGTLADIVVGAIVSVAFAEDGAVESVTILKDVQSQTGTGTPAAGAPGFGGSQEVTNGIAVENNAAVAIGAG